VCQAKPVRVISSLLCTSLSLFEIRGRDYGYQVLLEYVEWQEDDNNPDEDARKEVDPLDRVVSLAQFDVSPSPARASLPTKCFISGSICPSCSAPALSSAT
jgi:hypothetical protein